MRVCILTSNKPRHRYMANRIMERFDVVGLFSEAKQPKRHLADKEMARGKDADPDLVRYFNGFVEAEKRHLPAMSAEFAVPDRTRFFRVDPDRLNELELLQAMKELDIDCFAVFGTSLVKAELMKLSPYFVNIHLGLSPYYRGVATSFWPFYNDEPEYNGVTVFNLDLGIDSGPIFHQALVDAEAGDTIHDLSLKGIIGGVDLQLQALGEIEAGVIESHPQDLSTGKIYYNKDFTADVLHEVLQRWDDERWKRYVELQDDHKAKVAYVR